MLPKSEDESVLAAAIAHLCEEQSDAVIVVNPSSVPFDSLASAVDPVARFAFMPNHESILRSFRERNLLQVQHNFGRMPARGMVATWENGHTETAIWPGLALDDGAASAGMRRELRLRLSLPGYSGTGDTAAIYLEAYRSDSVDFGQLYVLTSDEAQWTVVDAAAVWTFTKLFRKGMILGCTVKNIQEDTLTYRSIDEIETGTAEAAKLIEELYRTFYSEPRPEGTVWIEAVVNCAGDVLKLRATSQEIGEPRFLDGMMDVLYSVKYVDNMRTERCGAVEVTYSFSFRG
jgi:hypothetical protein